MNVHVHNDIASQWMIQHQQKQTILPSICSNYTIMPDPNLEARHTCLLDGINIIKPTSEYSNPVFTIEDCLNVEGIRHHTAAKMSKRSTQTA